MEGIGPVLTVLNQPQTLLKGSSFTQRLIEICKDPISIEPLPDLKYKRILCPGINGGELHWAIMGFLAAALRVRGGEVTTTSCDSILPACVLRKAVHHENACTRWCHKNTVPFARAMKLPHRWYSEFITETERTECTRIAESIQISEISTFEFHDLHFWHLIEQSVMSYFKEGIFDPDRLEMQEKAREFLQSAMYLTIIGERVMNELNIDKVFTDSGQQVDWGVFRMIANRDGIPVDVILESPRKEFMFEIDRPPLPTQSMPGWEQWRHEPLTQTQEDKLDAYLYEREMTPYQFRGEHWTNRIVDPIEARRILGLDNVKIGHIFAMFPNIGFDAGKTKTDAAYNTAAEWVIETIKFFQDHPQHTLLIKIHPAEYHREVCDPLPALIEQHYPVLPRNLQLIDSRTELTAHCVLRLSDICIAYTSTVAAEAAALGKPVILVGGGWHAQRGISIDITSDSQYLEMMHRICMEKQPPETDCQLGRRYAYALFFRSGLPVNHFVWANDFDVVDIKLESLNDLAPGRDSTIDAICRGVLCDALFENPIA